VDDIGLRIPPAIARALRLISAHPSVQSLDRVARADIGTSAISVDIVVRLGLPNGWMADGVSPNGVGARETVTLTFPNSYPIDPPLIHLRRSFDRTLAHVQPGSSADRAVPCIYYGDVRELLQQEGLAGILNQLVVWLEKAALGRLIDPKQGWEHVRRDNTIDEIVADAHLLRSVVSKREDRAIFPVRFLRYRIGQFFGYQSTLDTSKIRLNPKNGGRFFGIREPDADVTFGGSLAIVAWPGKDRSGKPVIASRYQPETVVDFESLFARADDYGCGGALRAAICDVKSCFLNSGAGACPLPLIIVLFARRPFPLIGVDSDLELCPYLTEISASAFFRDFGSTLVRPAGHRHAISVPLLRRMSGADPEGQRRAWVQVGAGSLGSKIALHLARSGRAPAAVVDNQMFNPHNAARHALVPASGPFQRSWMGQKAPALCVAIGGLGQEAEPYVEDVTAVVRDIARARRVFPKASWAVVNATASLAVREAFAAAGPEVVHSRIIETSLFAGGHVGLLTTEGSDRNPNTGDLITEAYELMRHDPGLCPLVFPKGEAVQRQEIGEGCGSITAVMSDARISMFAAPMAEAIAKMQRDGLPDMGRILIGALGADELSLTWTNHQVAPYTVVEIDEAAGWRVRISDRAHRKIVKDVSEWPGRETGGILLGRVSEATQTFHVVDTLPAPVDSRRSPTEFVLGTKGARSTIRAYAEACNHSLYCLGTWHSHVHASDPSSTDRATAREVGLARPTPSVLLICTPAGYRALLADALQ